MTTTPGDRAAHATGWLLGEGRQLPDGDALLQGFAEMLSSLGVPVDRATVHAPTLHPRYRWGTRIWHPGEPAQETRRLHGIETTPTFHGNPVEHVSRCGTWLDIRLDGEDAGRFPLLEDLRAEGYVHYVMAPLAFATTGAGAASWATRHPDGFDPRDVALFAELVRPFETVYEVMALRRLTAELLGTYVGEDPARRILAGSVELGDIRHIRAAILLTDLRGFGQLSDDLPGEKVVALLNEHFACVVPAILAEGGEVLKYIGDGVLAVFDPARIAGGSARIAALRAAMTARASLKARNAAVEASHFDVGMALHVGDIAYGNVGAGARLDFTAIGRDVNIVSRLERFCKLLGEPVLMTDAFAAGLPIATRDLGRHAFRGFREELTIFAPAHGSVV